MTAHLLQLAVGPVQEFIAAARRTRDLWFGSYLLSEISKAAARAVRAKGMLIFPHHDTDLTPRREGVNVANIIVAELPAGVDPATTADEAKQAAASRWRQIADPVLDEFGPYIRANVWKEQVIDVVEFYAAWVPFTPSEYAAKRRRLARLMAGRKNGRDFRPAGQHARLPKSSLDGMRDTVFEEGNRKNWPRRLRVRPGEQLDVVGLVKRTALDSEEKQVGHRPYPSVSRIAADPWLRGLPDTEEGNAALRRLRDACRSLGDDDLLHPINTQRLHGDYARFPYEGTAVYRTRHHEMIEDAGETEERLADLRAALAEVERLAARLGLGAEPDPHLAVLVADGDHMGKAIDAIARLGDPVKHRNFSGELSKFAADAEGIVRNHNGVLIYSGGDDVLAFVPVDRALKCAWALYEAFETTMKRALADMAVQPPTLSVGVAIGHFNEHLEDLLNYGRAAENAAKQPNRDGLAVHLHKRGGVPVKVRKPWADRLDQSIAQYARWFRDGAVSGRTPYELHRLADVYDEWKNPATLAEAILSDAVRVIDKKRPGGDSKMAEIRQTIQRRVESPDQLREFARELLIARQLAVALRQSGSPEETKA